MADGGGGDAEVSTPIPSARAPPLLLSLVLPGRSQLGIQRVGFHDLAIWAVQFRPFSRLARLLDPHGCRKQNILLLPNSSSGFWGEAGWCAVTSGIRILVLEIWESGLD
jgi:hypothetical protein